MLPNNLTHEHEDKPQREGREFAERIVELRIQEHEHDKTSNYADHCKYLPNPCFHRESPQDE